MNRLPDRKKFCVLFKAIVSGRISNHEFELSLFNTQDRFIRELEEILWCSYDDYKEHKLEPSEMSPANRKLIARSVLFLNSDLNFNWPDFPSKLSWIFSFMTLGLFRYSYRERLKAYQDYGDDAYWPFRSRAELKLEASRPRVGLSLKYAN